MCSIGVYPGWNRSASNQPSHAGSNFGDGSEPLFSTYSKTAEKEDNKVVERWQRDAQGILIFVSLRVAFRSIALMESWNTQAALFSIVVAISVTISVQDLRPRSQDDSAFYLQNIYQLLANPNVYNTFTPPPPAVTPPPFSPPSYAVWVNSLWFLSLTVSLTSALLATSLLQWTRRYVTITQPIQSSPPKRARVRSFFADGIDKLHLPWVIEALPALLHLSLSLFLAGLLIFLFNVNQTAFKAVVGWAALFVGVYACITFMPIFRYDSPFYAPLSSTAWFLYASTLYAIFKVLSFLPGSRDSFRDLKDRYRGWVLGGVEKAAEDTALDRSSQFDCRILEWTIGTLCEDDATERFFEAIPGFFDSQVVQTRLPSLLQMKIRQVMDGFLDRTFSSESVPQSTKIGRLTICLNAAHAAIGPFGVSRILSNILDGRWREAPLSIKMAYALRRWCNNRDEWIALTARSIVARIIAVQKRDKRWIALVGDQFGLPDRVLRDYIPYGDSVLLAILLHVIRNLFHSTVPLWDSNILRVLSQFDIHNTLPQLQHDFCALWDEIVAEAHNRRPYSAPVFILREIRHLYVSLHEGTNSAPTAFSSSAHGDDSVWDPMSYSSCNIANHASVPPLHSYTSAAPFSAPYTDPFSAHTPYFTGQNVPHFSAPNWGTDQLQAESSFGNVVHAPQRSISVARSHRHVSFETSESQPLSTASLNRAAANTTQGDPDISTSSLIHTISQPISRNGSPLQRSEELTVTVASPPVVSDSAPPPIPMSTVSQTNTVDFPPMLESPHPQSGDIFHAPGSLSLSSPFVDPQLASDLDSQIIGTTTAQHDARDAGSSAPIPISPNTSESTSRPEDYGRDLNPS